jgi:hypothetical protein
MTMQSSGPISLCQAGIECQFGYPVTINAGNQTISELGYRSSGQALAWSYWYGQSYLAPIPYQIAVDYQIVVDMNGQTWFNYRTGAYSYAFDGNNNPRLLYWTTYLTIPQINSYTSFSGTVVNYTGRDSGNTYVAQAPTASVDWQISVHYFDNDNNASVYGSYLYAQADNRFG